MPYYNPNQSQGTGRGAPSSPKKKKDEAPNVAVRTGDNASPDTTDASDGATILASQSDDYEQDIRERRDPTIAAVNRLIDLAESTDERNQAAIEEFIGTSLPKLEALAAKADAGDYAALSALTHAYGNFQQLAPPEMVAAAESDPEDVQRQLDAYGMQADAAAKFKKLSDPTITGEERYMMELARREEEGSRRAAMQAQLRDMDARGARSGGAEMGALLGSQQITSDARALQDLAWGANAQQRAMDALKGYGDTTAQMSTAAGNIRDAGDVMSRFNQEQAQQWSQWESDFKAKQQNDAAGRERDLFDAKTYANESAYNRGADVVSLERDATAMKTGQYNAGGSQISDAIKMGIGVQEGRRAEDALKPKKRKAWEQVLDPADIFSLDL